MGLVLVLALYTLIIIIGVYTAWKFKRHDQEEYMDSAAVAGRDLGLIVGVFTMSGKVCND